MTHSQKLDKYEEAELARIKKMLEDEREELMRINKAPTIKIYPGINIISVRRTK